MGGRDEHTELSGQVATRVAMATPTQASDVASNPRDQPGIPDAARRIKLMATTTFKFTTTTTLTPSSSITAWITQLEDGGHKVEELYAAADPHCEDY